MVGTRGQAAPGDQHADASAYLARLLTCAPADRHALAVAGLAATGCSGDTELLLRRHMYRALIERGQLEPALAQAERMTALAVELGQLREVAHHDATRVLAALGRWDEAIASEQAALHTATPSRRSFHSWSLATVQHFGGRSEEAVHSLDRGLAVAQADRPLLECHRVWVELDGGLLAGPASGEVLRRVFHARLAPHRGYLSYLHGMIASRLGDLHLAQRRLTAWLHRQQQADAVQRLTLQEEIRRATAIVTADPLKPLS